jgi:hypothetical protein
MSPFQLSLMEFSVAGPGAVLTSGSALFYLRRVRLERPAIGVFNSRDIRILFSFIVILPLMYALLPHWALTFFLSITFASALSIGLRPVLRPIPLWILVGTLIGANIWLNRTMLGTVYGWQLAWLEGDMKLKHVSGFALALAGYDVLFTTILPVNSHLAEEFLGWPLDPSFGFRYGLYNATIGVGDLLVYSLFLIATFKAYGRTAARLAMGLIVAFGVVAVCVAPLVLDIFVTARTDVAIPAQTLFGPAAFAAYLWMRRHYGRERTMQEFLASDDAVRPAVLPAVAPALLPTPAAPASAAASA